ncbi:hypothetical protein EW146_g2712 [Bondarzewia mesenterica]|uniref:Uncharacterized protein n=1 Tax=Bondarzewia mesenterica TaxID=1095465 RepID=A0A4S4M1P0_9AGAM|nr:hypothetical protein EW146_g2712 [Bondarzewia mesenterica]
MLDAFRLKEFDLEPVFTEWKTAPIFLGNPKKDPPVDDWLDQIKAGCIERKVPREYWHKVGQNYLGDKARVRLNELKAVLRNMHGGKYRWDWKKFKVAMRNMGWDIDTSQTEAIKVQSRPSGVWWILGGREQQGQGDDSVNKEKTQVVDKGRKATSSSQQQKEKEKPEKVTESAGSIATKAVAGWLSRTPSTASLKSVSSAHNSGKESIKSDAMSCTSTTYSRVSSPASSVATTPAQSPGEVTTTVTHAPVWLLNACNALDFLNIEHPKSMSAVAAVLITIGTLPAIPALATGAGGAILASHAVQAAGAIAVGLGNWLKASQDATAAKLAQTQQAADESSSR